MTQIVFGPENGTTHPWLTEIPLRANEALQVKRYCLLASEDQLLAQLNTDKWFANAHARSGFWQKCPAERKKKTRSSVHSSPPSGLMPFGMDSGPEWLNRCLSHCWMHLSSVMITMMIFLCIWRRPSVTAHSTFVAAPGSWPNAKWKVDTCQCRPQAKTRGSADTWEAITQRPVHTK